MTALSEKLKPFFENCDFQKKLAEFIGCNLPDHFKNKNLHVSFKMKVANKEIEMFDLVMEEIK